MKLYHLGFLAALLLAVVGAVWGTAPTTAQTPHVQSPARLAMPEAVAATTGVSVTVPIAFQHGGNAIGSTTFSIDFDESCLAFNEHDGNSDGRPDAVRSNVPLAFRLSVSYNASDSDGELDMVIADYSFPIASLPDHEALITVGFTARCLPDAGQIINAPVLFSQAPGASFSDANGLDVAGTTRSGLVAIQAPSADSPTATPTSTPTPGPGTPSTTPTATVEAPTPPSYRGYLPLLLHTEP